MLEFNSIVDVTSPETIQAIWEKARRIDGYNEDLYRQDYAGAWIARDQYGNKESSFGWEIDHIYPRAKGGEDYFGNLRPIQWENNIKKGDDYPKYKAIVSSDGNKYSREEKNCTVKETLQNRLKEQFGYA
jgi:hypothetical protein